MIKPEIISIGIEYFIIAGIIYYIIYAVSSHFLKKIALQKIKNSLQEGEYIISEPQNDFVIDIIAPFFIGGFIGVYIFPFFINSEIQYIKASYTGSINREYLPLLIIGTLILTIFYFYVACTKFVLTNKRMIYAWTFNLLYKFMNIFHKFDYLYYSDINNFGYGSHLGAKFLDVYTKNNKRFWISGFKNLDKFESIIEQYR